MSTKKVSSIIDEAKLDTACSSECAICFDTPKHKDALITECSHIYCVKCWYSWTNTLRIIDPIHCPICRKKNPDTYWFRAIQRPGFRNIHIPHHLLFLQTLPDKVPRKPIPPHLMRFFIPPPMEQFRPPVTDDDDVVFITAFSKAGQNI